MARKNDLGKHATKEWAKHLRRDGKQDHNRRFRKLAKRDAIKRAAD